MLLNVFNGRSILLCTLPALIIVYLSPTTATQRRQQPYESISSHQRNDNKTTASTIIAASTRTRNDDEALEIQNNFERILTQQLRKEQETSKSEKTLLSRKRRYLLFPEGSSFQLVWDGIIGVVDYTNYLILGITLALAWELPSKAPSEMIEEITEHLKDGTLTPLGVVPGSRNDTVTNITYVDTKPSKTTPKLNYIHLVNPSPLYGQSSPGDESARYNYYYTSANRLRPAFQTPMHAKYSYFSNHNPNTDRYYRPLSKKKDSYQPRVNDWRRKDMNYYKGYYSERYNPLIEWMKKPGNHGKSGVSGYPWWNLKNRFPQAQAMHQGKPQTNGDAIKKITNINGNGRRHQESQQLLQPQRKPEHPNNGYYQSRTARKHHIYPIFGKRSLPFGNANSLRNNVQQQTPPDGDSVSPASNSSSHHQRQRRRRRSGCATALDDAELSKYDRIHIRHHRRTRHTLYEKIEKYLDKRGSNGHHCVLRTLCETGQKSLTDRQPGSFVGELMRAVFTLPEPFDEDMHYKDSRYDAANAFEGDCTIRYHLCENSLWKSEFII